MRVVERVADLRDHLECLRGLDPRPAQDLMEIGAIHIFHDKVAVPGAGLAEIIDRDDSAVLELRERARLALEADEKIAVRCEFGGQELDRHRAVERGLHALVNRTHPAAPEQALDAVLREELREFLGLGGSHAPAPSVGFTVLRPRASSSPGSRPWSFFGGVAVGHGGDWFHPLLGNPAARVAGFRKIIRLFSYGAEQLGEFAFDFLRGGIGERHGHLFEDDLAPALAKTEDLVLHRAHRHAEGGCDFLVTPLRLGAKAEKKPERGEEFRLSLRGELIGEQRQRARES